MRQNKNESLSRSYDTAAVAGCDTVGPLLVVAMAFCPQPPPPSCLVLEVVLCSALCLVLELVHCSAQALC